MTPEVAADAMRAAFAIACAEVGLDVADVLRPEPGPSIMDATLADLSTMELQARHYLEAMKLVRQWVLSGEMVRLGDRLKTVPTDVAELIEQHLGAAGLLR